MEKYKVLNCCGKPECDIVILQSLQVLNPVYIPLVLTLRTASGT